MPLPKDGASKVLNFATLVIFMPKPFDLELVHMGLLSGYVL